jgi:hypothetical protein
MPEGSAGVIAPAADATVPAATNVGLTGAVVKLQTVPVVVPPAFFSSIRQ